MLALLLMAATVYLLLTMPSGNRGEKPLSTQPSQSALSGFSTNGSDTANLIPFADGVLRLGGKRIALVDLNGGERYAVDVDLASPAAAVGDGYLLVYDRGGYRYWMLDGDGIRYQGTRGKRIEGASIAGDGTCALILDQMEPPSGNAPLTQQGRTGSVVILRPDGSSPYALGFDQSGYVLSVAFLEDSKSFDVILANTDTSRIQPVVSRYSVDRPTNDTSDPAVHALARLEIEALLPLACHDRSGKPILAGRSAILGIDFGTSADSVIRWQRDFAQVQTISPGGAGLLAVVRQKDEPNWTLLRLSVASSGDRVEDALKLALDGEPTGFAVRGQRAALGIADRLMLIDTQSGRVIVDRQLDQPVQRVGFNTDGSLTVVTSGGVWRVPDR